VGQAGPERQERAVQVDGVHLFPIGEGIIFNRVDDLDAHVRDKHIYPVQAALQHEAEGLRFSF
jgi:hypothetical protein